MEVDLNDEPAETAIVDISEQSMLKGFNWKRREPALCSVDSIELDEAAVITDVGVLVRESMIPEESRHTSALRVCLLKLFRSESSRHYVVDCC